MRSSRAFAIALLLAGSSLAAAEAPGKGDGPSFDATAASAQEDLKRSQQELVRLRESIAAEKLPLNKTLGTLEQRLIKLRTEAEEAGRALDRRNLDLANLRTAVESRHAETTYLASLLDEYVRNFESRVHISELQRYRETLSEARLAADSGTMSRTDAFRAQTELVQVSLERLLDLVGGTKFDGTAVDNAGRVRDVTFALLGPVALYGAKDGTSAGLAEQRLGSLEPNMIELDQPELTEAAKALVATGSGRIPFDPTLGNAQKIEATRDTLAEHVVKGGPVMIPILLLAGAALLVSLAKWVHLVRVRTPSKRSVQELLEAMKRGDFVRARTVVGSIGGPTGEMLSAGMDHVSEARELVEESMFEKVLDTRLRLQSFLPFVAVCATAAPLLGLLGTVTGIINTFKLITVYGTGDAKTLSSGISEALITTEFGLIIAIPALLLHAYLSRRARRIVDGMEKTGVSFLNRIPRAHGPRAPQAVEQTSSSVVGASACRPAFSDLRPGAVLAQPEALDH